MHLLKQTLLGFLIAWIVYAIFMGAFDLPLMNRVIWFLDEYIAHALVVVSAPLAGFLTALLAKKKEWSSNTFVGALSGTIPVLYLIVNSRNPLSGWDIIWFISLAVLHTAFFSAVGFFVQKRRLDKLKDYNVTDQRIDSFGEKFKERK